MWFVVILLARRKKKIFWQVYFLHGHSANNRPITASQDLMIQCLENDMSSSFIQIHHFLDIMLLEAMVVRKSILVIL
jgi:hypothetical protein